MLELEILDKSDLRHVYEWDRAHAIEPYEIYAARLTGPQWAHYGIWTDGTLTGCVSLELLGPTECSVHLAKQPGGDGAELRKILIDLGVLLFNGNFTRLLCQVKPGNDAAYSLVRACGMTEIARNDEYITLALTANEYFTNPLRWK